MEIQKLISSHSISIFIQIMSYRNVKSTKMMAFLSSLFNGLLPMTEIMLKPLTFNVYIPVYITT